MNAPIAVLSFNRPLLLQATLESLAAQTVEVDGTCVFLFQDGVDPRDANADEDASSCDRCCEIFHRSFPDGHILRSDVNLGIALNMDRAERHLFVDLKADLAVVFEDDMVLAPDYLRMLEQLSAYMLDDDRIGYVAAYGDHFAPLSEQRAHRHEVVPLRHKWGFALSRRQWLRQNPIVQDYLAIVSRTDYRRRDHDAIRAFYKKLGYGSPATSQDAIKDVCGSILGTTKIMSKVCFGKYIGMSGVHFTPEVYEELGYGKTELWSGPMPKLRFPSRGVIDDWIEAERARARRAASAAA